MIFDIYSLYDLRHSFAFLFSVAYSETNVLVD